MTICGVKTISRVLWNGEGALDICTPIVYSPGEIPSDRLEDVIEEDLEADGEADMSPLFVRFIFDEENHPIFELANKKINMGNYVNEKINKLLPKISSFLPNNITARLLHGDLWEGNILFQDKKFVGFIDPGSFFGHNEMEVAYLRWFNPSFIDTNFIEKYNNYINLDKDYYSYETIYQLYYALCNVVLWDKSYIKEVENLLKKLKI